MVQEQLFSPPRIWSASGGRTGGGGPKTMSRSEVLLILSILELRGAYPFEPEPKPKFTLLPIIATTNTNQMHVLPTHSDLISESYAQKST